MVVVNASRYIKVEYPNFAVFSLRSFGRFRKRCYHQPPVIITTSNQLGQLSILLTDIILDGKLSKIGPVVLHFSEISFLVPRAY